MLRFRWIEVFVGILMIAALMAFFILAFKVSGYSFFGKPGGFKITAEFDNIGELKVRSPVTIAGVRVGEVTGIHLNSANYKAVVSLRLDSTQDKIPVDSSAQILTQGLLGSKYIGLTPGFEDRYLGQNGVITETHPALILENLIGQLIYNADSKGEKK